MYESPTPARSIVIPLFTIHAKLRQAINGPKDAMNFEVEFIRAV